MSAVNVHSNCPGESLDVGCFLYDDAGHTTPVADGMYANAGLGMCFTVVDGEIIASSPCGGTTTTTTTAGSTTTTTTAAPTTTTTTTAPELFYYEAEVYNCQNCAVPAGPNVIVSSTNGSLVLFNYYKAIPADVTVYRPIASAVGLPTAAIQSLGLATCTDICNLED